MLFNPVRYVALTLNINFLSVIKIIKQDFWIQPLDQEGERKWFRVLRNPLLDFDYVKNSLPNPTLLYKDCNLERPGTITHFNQINNPPAKMGSRKPWLSLTSFCVVFAMLVAVAKSDSAWSSTPVKASVALQPTPPPTTGAGDGGSAAAEFNPHLFTTPFLLPIIIGLSALF